jgi:putative ABC transport system permease protein
VPGVEKVAMAAWPLLSGNTWNAFVSIEDRPAELRPYFLTVSPGWADVMKIPFVDGRDFRANETYPGVAIVNEAFARYYFGGENPIGRSFLETPSRGNALPKEAEGTRYRVRIVGLVADARYRNLREPILPTVYVPFRSVDAAGALEPIGWGTFLVRTSVADPLSLAPMLRDEVPRTRSEFRVSSIRTQTALNQSHAVRERLLATLAVFFAGVALLLAGVGLCGVLHYSVLQRRREIGIRLALGSGAGDVARRVTFAIFSMVLLGSIAGLALGLASQSYIETLLYDVTVNDPWMLALPWAAMIAVALLSALPAVINAVRTDPAITLRGE